MARTGRPRKNINELSPSYLKKLGDTEIKRRLQIETVENKSNSDNGFIDNLKKFENGEITEYDLSGEIHQKVDDYKFIIDELLHLIKTDGVVVKDPYGVMIANPLLKEYLVFNKEYIKLAQSLIKIAKDNKYQEDNDYLNFDFSMNQDFNLFGDSNE